MFWASHPTGAYRRSICVVDPRSEIPCPTEANNPGEQTLAWCTGQTVTGPCIQFGAEALRSRLSTCVSGTLLPVEINLHNTTDNSNSLLCDIRHTVSGSEQHRTSPRHHLPSPIDAPPGSSQIRSELFSTFTRLTVRPPPSFIQGSPTVLAGGAWSLTVRDGFAGVLATVPRWFRCCSEPLTTGRPVGMTSMSFCRTT